MQGAKGHGKQDSADRSGGLGDCAGAEAFDLRGGLPKI